MHSEMSFHSRQRNDHFIHAVPEFEVHQSFNGDAWIEWLGIASSPHFDSYLHSSKLFYLNLSSQDSLSLNFSLDGNRFT